MPSNNALVVRIKFNGIYLKNRYRKRMNEWTLVHNTTFVLKIKKENNL